MISDLFCKIVRILETESHYEKQSFLSRMIDMNTAIMSSPKYTKYIKQNDISIRELFGVEVNKEEYISDGLLFYCIYKSKPITVHKYSFQYVLEYDDIRAHISKSVLMEMMMVYDEILYELNKKKIVIPSVGETIYFDLYHETILATKRENFFTENQCIKLGNNVFNFIATITNLKYQIEVNEKFNNIDHINVIVNGIESINLHPFELYTIEKIKGLIK